MNTTWTALPLLAVLSACTQDPGRVSVTFVWTDPAPDAAAELWIHAVVEHRPGGEGSGTVLGSAVSPLSQPDLQIPSIPHGEDRLVVLEIRDGPDRTDSFVVYRGRSGLFSLHAGEVVVAQVDLQLERTPQLPSTDPISVATANAGGYVRQARVRLRVDVSRASRLIFSEDRSFGSTSERLVTGPPPFEVHFDLEAGTCDDGDCPNEAHTVYVKAVDAEGYVSRPAAVSVVLDRRAPAVVRDSDRVAVVRSGTNPVKSTEALAKAGSVVNVELVATEALARPPVVRGGGPGFVVFEEAGSGQSVYRFRHVVSAASPEGAHVVVVSLEDRAGHTRTTTLAARFGIDLTPPPAPSAERLHLERAPWGRDGGAARFTVTSAANTAEAGAVAIVYDRAGAGAVELGRGEVGSTGAVGRLALDGADRAVAFVSIADQAGNESAPAAVGRATWIANLGGKQRGRADPNPHTLVLSESLVPSLVQDSRITAEPAQADLDRIASSAGPPVITDAPHRWTRTRGSRPSQPSARAHPLMGYDRERGRLVVMGGRREVGVFELGAGDWQEVTPASAVGPAERFGRLVNFAPSGG